MKQGRRQDSWSYVLLLFSRKILEALGDVNAPTIASRRNAEAAASCSTSRSLLWLYAALVRMEESRGLFWGMVANKYLEYSVDQIISENIHYNKNSN